MNVKSFSGQGTYEIKVKGHLDKRWSRWFEGCLLLSEENGMPITIFTGTAVDQAALHGILQKIRDINITLISVNRIHSNTED